MISDLLLVLSAAAVGWFTRVLVSLWHEPRGRQVDADGRCTCRALEDATAHIRELYRQDKALHAAFLRGVPVDEWRDKGIGA